MSSSKGCTCAPHPRLDLTDAYIAYHRGAVSSDGPNGVALGPQFDQIRRKIHEACRSHGCFHVAIRCPIKPSNTSPLLPVQCLAKDREEIEREIESLFSPNFLQDTLNNVEGDICNGGTLEARFHNGSNNNVKHGIFRGRAAESGDEEQSRPEPKLSWEYQRCCSTKQFLDETTLCEDIKSTTIDESWKLLPQWTDALHSVAVAVIHVLGIPRGLALQEDSCSCSQTSTPNDCESKCNIDLLRVFRYDPLDSNDSALGSSAHSDWGSLTVVWQDDKGGLETYCNACNKWSSVDASCSDDPSSEEEDNDATIQCFVHIGDFLSLATIHESTEVPAWHSPRHRVSCPIKSPNDATTAHTSSYDNGCRRSLVYFAYPPPGIFLADAQRVIGPFSGNNLSLGSIVGMDMYSVLHDQSGQTVMNINKDTIACIKSEGSSKLMYEEIRNVPFDQVIARKWGQVQRK